VLASVFNTYPNTTFSQNNGVIQLTGVASRYVGLFVAGLLIFFAMFPIVGGLFQVMPKPLLYGATGLMFALISVSGFKIISMSTNVKTSAIVAAIAVFIALLMKYIVGHTDNIHPQLALFLGFPVALGTIMAILLEVFCFKYQHNNQT
jgi:xanthine permease XanP